MGLQVRRPYPHPLLQRGGGAVATRSRGMLAVNAGAILPSFPHSAFFPCKPHLDLEAVNMGAVSQVQAPFTDSNTAPSTLGYKIVILIPKP